MPADDTPDLGRAGFARTNRQTIAQRAALIRALLPKTHSSAEWFSSRLPDAREVRRSGPDAPGELS